MDNPTTPTAPDFNEDRISQVPAILLLQNIGYTYLSPDEALALRGGKLSNVLLEGILVPWLRDNNRFRYKGNDYPLSENNIHTAVQALKETPFDGLIRTNEKIYDLLCLGKSLQQQISGDLKSATLKYIDWENPGNNVYHLTEEFSVERTGSHETRRPDIVLFVNGIPLCIIECKSPHIKEPMREAISQHIRNQKDDEIPKLFIYSQSLLALSKNEALYATTGTPLKFWAQWHEEDEKLDETLKPLIEQPVSEEQIDKMYGAGFIREKRPAYGTLTRQVTEQDRALYALCRPERLLELAYRFILYDAGVKKIARYQQYFSVKNILERIQTRDAEGRRLGGLVWHTQGSGKSLTMVMLAKSLALAEGIADYRIVLVTDRVDLDDQIYKTFKHCGKEIEQAESGKELCRLLETGKQRIVATIIDKFEAAVSKQQVEIPGTEIFVLVDEGHRTQYGPRHAKMRRVLPNACYIGFTGTPVMKKDKDTVRKFGGLIEPTYTIDKAVADKAVVPLLYEGRHIDQFVDEKGIDAWFERVTQNLSKEQAADLKKKFSTTDQLNKADQKVKAIAWDIGEHFRDNWQGTGFKGQLVTQDKSTALTYKRYLDEFGMVSSEVLISGPDEREGETDIYKENSQEVQRFWKAMMQRFGSEKAYNKQLVNAFKTAEHPEIIIVVDKLLTGFDAPKNTVMYLTRTLKDHTLLQAIARVNRVEEGKDFGYIIDYRGVLSNLGKALDLYRTLPEFDAADIGDALTDVRKEIEKLPEKHTILWDTFKEIQNRGDEEEYERLLADEEKRPKFYERLSVFSRSLAIALASEAAYEVIPRDTIERYKKDLAFFIKLRASIRRRYAEVVDFGEYEPKIQKLLDTYVGAGTVERMTPLVNIFDKEAFAQEVDKVQGAAAKADTIAYRTSRMIHERMGEDEVFYKRFSELLKDAIRVFREGRISDNEYLRRVSDYWQSVLNRTGDKIPRKLDHRDVAKAYFGVVKEVIPEQVFEHKERDELIADMALLIDDTIERLRIVNWANNSDAQNRIRTAIEDVLFDFQKKQGIAISFAEIDAVMERCIATAKVRRP